MIVALVEPEIPYNTGNLARLCVATDTPLILAGRLGFTLDDRYLKRAGLDYWEYLKLYRYPVVEEFWEWVENKNFAILTKRGEKLYTEIDFSMETILIFGSETRGISEKIIEKFRDRTYRIPMWGKVRSLNLSSSVAIVLYEGYRQLSYF